MNVVSGHVIAWLAAHPEVHSLSFGAKRSFCDHYLICHGAPKKRGKATYDVHSGREQGVGDQTIKEVDVFGKRQSRAARTLCVSHFWMVPKEPPSTRWMVHSTWWACRCLRPSGDAAERRRARARVAAAAPASRRRHWPEL